MTREIKCVNQCAVVLFAGLVLASPAASAYVRVCKWNLTADVTVDINPDGFEKYGLDRYFVWKVMAGVATEWHTRAGLQFRFIVSDTFVTDTSPQTGHVLLKADDYGGAGIAAQALTLCGPGLIVVHMQNWYFPAGFSQSGYTDVNLYEILLHEFGHVLGFEHSSATYSVMDSTGTVASELTHDDIDGARTGVCYYGSPYGTCQNCTLISGSTYDCSYARRTTSTLRGLRSTNDGSTWSENNSGS